MSDNAGTFYRVIGRALASEADFECDALKYFQAMQAGLRPRYFPRNGWQLRQWSGVSMFNSLQASRVAAREYSLGQYIAVVVLPPSNGRDVLVEAAGGRGHYIIWARPDLLLSCVRRVVSAVE